MGAITTVCDGCGAEISVIKDRKQIPLDRDTDGGAITCDCLVCPKCERKYVILIHDRKTDNYIAKAQQDPTKGYREKALQRQAELKKRYGFE